MEKEIEFRTEVMYQLIGQIWEGTYHKEICVGTFNNKDKCIQELHRQKFEGYYRIRKVYRRTKEDNGLFAK